jgi:SAM-dependent methyltransferase
MRQPRLTPTVKKLEPNPAPFFAWDRKTPQYYRSLRIGADTHLHEQIFSLIARVIPPENAGRQSLVVDLGCGEGALAQRLWDAGYSVIGVDKQREAFRAWGPRFVFADFDRPEEAEGFLSEWMGKVDLVVAVEIIEHLRRPWEFVQLCHKLARPGGQLVVTTPNVASWWSRLWFLLRGELWGFGFESWHDPGHVHPFTYVELEKLLEEVGFRACGVYLGGCLPVIWGYNWKRFLASLALLPLRPLMGGFRDGWVLCIHAEKPVNGESPNSSPRAQTLPPSQ